MQDAISQNYPTRFLGILSLEIKQGINKIDKLNCSFSVHFHPHSLITDVIWNCTRFPKAFITSNIRIII